ncbi:hypothetical protein Ae168Ps1_5635c [Pseudonocardia sp. Ae168_Ps1]|nr:hypothetical protein Ae168Ps1_5635c [Pseudonocardia sp. Ae168_Ps1]
MHGEDDGRGVVDLPEHRAAVGRRYRPQHPHVEVGVDDDHHERAEHRREQQRRGERPHRRQVHVVGLGRVAAYPLDPGDDLGVCHPGDRQGDQQDQRAPVDLRRVRRAGDDQCQREQLDGQHGAEQPRWDRPHRPPGDPVQRDGGRRHALPPGPARRHPGAGRPALILTGIGRGA